jgi:ATP phosphoribosyltransferase regulatory subunit
MSPSLSTRLRALYESAGATFIDIPVLHPADPFLETAGEDVRRRMFVTEGPQGERLALRPDFTIPVCLEHLKQNAGPRRYAYEGLVFRRHDQGSPERLETGYEDIGRTERVKADAKALALAISCAREASERPLAIRLGDIGVFDALLRKLGLPGRWRRRLRRCCGLPDQMHANLERMSAPRQAEDERLDGELRAIAHDREKLLLLLADRRDAHGHAEGAGRSPEEIADRFLDRRAIPDAANAARASQILTEYLSLSSPLGEAAAMLEVFAKKHALDFDAAIEPFDLRAAAIIAKRPSANIRFEAGFGRPLDYYTGLVFEIRAEAIDPPLVGGGRYDRMLEMLGAASPLPAVGFTMRLDLIDTDTAP